MAIIITSFLILADFESEESPGQSTEEDVAFFYAETKRQPDRQWDYAVVNRDRGLILVDGEYCLKFRSATCGFIGTGPAGTIEILIAAGFCDPEEPGEKFIIKDLIETNQHIGFARPSE